MLIDHDLNVVAWNSKCRELLHLTEELFETAIHMSTIFRSNAQRGDYGPGDPEQYVETGLARRRLMEAHVFERTRPDVAILEVQDCNPKFAEIFGWDSPAELVGQPRSVFWLSDG